jgi:hypothetical protein
MSRVKWTVVLVVFAGSLACAPVAEEATAAVVSAAPVWPIPAGAPAGPAADPEFARGRRHVAAGRPDRRSGQTGCGLWRLAPTG